MVQRYLKRHRRSRISLRRRGAAALDYVLLLGIVLPLAAFILGVAPRIIKLSYEMACVLFSWPFM